MLAIFDEKIEIRERCKGVHCVDLGESFPTSIYFQKSASIQPRTSLSKFGVTFNSLFICLLTPEPPFSSVWAGLFERNPVEVEGMPKIGCHNKVFTKFRMTLPF